MMGPDQTFWPGWTTHEPEMLKCLGMQSICNRHLEITRWDRMETYVRMKRDLERRWMTHSNVIIKICGLTNILWQLAFSTISRVIGVVFVDCSGESDPMVSPTESSRVAGMGLPHLIVALGCTDSEPGRAGEVRVGACCRKVVTWRYACVQSNHERLGSGSRMWCLADARVIRG